MAETDKSLKIAVGVDVVDKEKIQQLMELIGKLTTPELGEALAATLEGPIGWATAAVIAFKALDESIKKSSDELDKFTKEKMDEHLARINAVRDAWKEVRTGQAEYLDQLAEAGRDKDPVGTQIQRIKEIEAAQLESDKKVIESLGQVIEQKIRAAGGSEAEIQAARRHTQTAVDTLDDAAADRSIADKEAILARAKQDEPTLESAEVAAENTAGRTSARYVSEKGNLDELQKPETFETLGQNIETAVAALEDAKQGVHFWENRDDSGQGDYADELAAARTKVQEAETELALQKQIMANNEKRLAQLQILVPQLEQENAGAKRAWEEAKTATLLNKKRLGQLPGEIGNDRSIAQIKTDGHAEAADLAGAVEKVATVDRAALAGRQLDASQAAQIVALTALLEKAHANSSKILNLIMNGVKKHESIEQIISEVQAALANSRNNSQG